MGLYTAADDPADFLKSRATPPPTGSPFVDGLSRGAPAAAAEAAPVAEVAAAAPKAGILGRLASGAGNLASGAGSLLAVGSGFANGAGLLNTPATAAAVGNNNQPGTDVPTDLSPERKAQMMVPSDYKAPGPANPVMGYLKQSRDGILSGINNASVQGALNGANALPGAMGAIGAVQNIAKGGGIIARAGANLIGETPMLNKIGEGLGQAAVGTGFIQPAPGPISAAAAKGNPVQERVAGVIQQMNGTPAPGLTGVTQQPTSVNGISQLTGGQFKSPMFTDDPNRAAAEYGSKKNSLFSVVPNTVEADKSYLQGAFLKHINSGDLDRAAATAVSPQDQAALGIAYTQRQQAQAQAAQTEPLQRMLTESLEKDQKGQGGGIRDHAFGGSLRGRGGAAQGDSSQGTAGIISQLLAAQKGGQPQQSPMAQALAQTAGQQAADTNIEGQKIAQQGAKITQQGLLQTQALQKQLLTEKDPEKRAQIIENIQTLTGKYEKAVPAAKAVIEDFDTGQKDMMGQPIYKKRAINPETGEPITKPAAAAKPTRVQLEAEAKTAIAGGANKDSVASRLKEKMKEYGL